MIFMKTLNVKPNQLFFRSSFFALLVLGFFSQSIWAQATNRFSADYLKLGGSNGVATDTTSIQGNHRVLLDDEGSNLLTLGLGLTQTTLEDDRSTGPDRYRELRTLVPTFSLMRILNDEYSLVVTLRPGFYGTLNDNLGDDFRLEGGVVVTKFMSENLTMGFGLGRGTNFGRDLIVPLFQFVWFASEKVIVRGLLPIRASAWYIPTQDWELGVIYSLQGSLYNIEGDTNIPGARRVGFAAANVGVGARYNLFGTNFLSIETGVTALRRYVWSNDTGPSFKITADPWRERDLDRVPYVNIGWVQKF
jgi:hypothetical protein